MKKITLRLLTLSLAVITLTTPAISSVVTEPVPVNSSVPSDNKVTSALDEFNSLSRKERKSRIKDAKKLLKNYKSEKRAGKAADDNTVLLAILAILLPPLAVYLKEGEINSKFWISLILTLIFWVPGIIYALLVVFDVI
ncbi:MAG: YqaE/Pmp3 family membrane protein [Chitinophagaceae bacterium]|nr:YqaE/Pmp3 family membrane protein [Chitinophagaceae bacterium]